MITLRQLQIFVEAVRAGSFRRCGELIGMSQVSVSEHVRALESRWGVALFDRRPGAASTLTEAGRHAYERASLILADIADMDKEMTIGKQGERRQVPIALHTYMIRDLYTEIAEIEQRHNVSLDFDLGLYDPAILANRIATRELDLAYFIALSAQDLLGSSLIGSEPLAIFVGPEHRFATREALTLEELAVEPFAQLDHRNPLGALIIRAFAACGIAELTVGLETNDFGLIVNFLLRSRGFACLFASTVDEPGPTHGLVRVPLADPLPPLEIRLLARRTSQRDTVLTAFTAAVAKGLRPAGPSGRL